MGIVRLIVGPVVIAGLGYLVEWYCQRISTEVVNWTSQYDEDIRPEQTLDTLICSKN